MSNTSNELPVVNPLFEEKITNEQVNQPLQERNSDPAYQKIKHEMIEDAKQYISNEFESIIEKEIQNRSNVSNRKSVVETKKLIETFKEKTANYPKYMSYEGSMVLCILLSLNPVVSVHMSQIPSIDQKLIRELLVVDEGRGFSDFNETFDVRFDSSKDFILIFNPQNHKDITLNLFNTVAHPRPSDLKDNAEVLVDNAGEKIEIGGKIHLNKSNVQKLVGLVPSEERERVAPKQVGRNAYEIRADVLQMAIDWAVNGDIKTGKYQKMTDEDVIALARKFYSFVENRR